MGSYRFIALTGILTLSLASAASALTLHVGPGQTYKSVSQAAEAAHDGDTVQIVPGIYTDCAVWKQNRLTIESTGSGVVFQDTSCNGKGIFVINGTDVTVRGITFKNAHVADKNGAGIREDGINLTVENSTFIDNEMGILTNPQPTSTIIVRNSHFARNGSCFPNCPNNIYMHAFYAGRAALVHIENSVFEEQHDGHYVKSRASRTEVVNCTIKDGPNGTSSYLIDIPNGGSLLVSGNTMEKGAKAENKLTAIDIGEEGLKNSTTEIIVQNNDFTNDTKAKTVFVRNLTGTAAVLSNNTFHGTVIPLENSR